MRCIECESCNFVGSGLGDDEDFYESFEIMSRINDDGDEEEYEVFCLECPKCGYLQNHVFD